MPYKDKEKYLAYQHKFKTERREILLATKRAWRDSNKDKIRNYDLNRKDLPKTKYTQQKAQAKRRGISWEFTFESWWKMWEESGKWEQRGYSKGKYCMCRKNDVGPYSTSNVIIASTEENKRKDV